MFGIFFRKMTIFVPESEESVYISVLCTLTGRSILDETFVEP